MILINEMKLSCQISLLVLALIMGGSGASLWAHAGHEHHHHVEDVDDSKLATEAERRAHAGALHHQLEAAADGERGAWARFVEWRRGFHPLIIRSNMVRTFRGAHGKSYQDAMADIVFIFGISHPLEMAAGLAATSAGVTMEWPLWLTSLAASGGGLLISVPGFDPGCLIIIGGYAATKPEWLAKTLTPYRWLVRGGRKFVVYEIKHLSHMLGLPQLSNLVLERRPGMEAALALHANEIRTGSLQRFHEEQGVEHLVFFTYDFRARQEVPAIDMKWVSEEGRDPYLDEITFDLKSGIPPEEWAKKSKGFRWNIQSLVKEVRRLVQKNRIDVLQNRFYVEDLVQDEETLTLRLKRNMIHLPKQTRLRSLREMASRGCQGFLSLVQS